MKQNGFLILAVALSGFQFGCSQTPSIATNANSGNANVVSNNQNTTVAASNTANFNAEVVEAKNYSKTVKAQAEDVGQSIKNGDFDKLVEYIHPKVFEMAGGRETLIKQGKEALAEARSEGYEIVSYTVGEPKSAVAVDKELFVVVPAVLVVKEPKGAYKNDTTMIAISNDNGASWKFLTDMNQARFRAHFPAAATKLIIPEDKIVPVAQK
jgi:hypothetical protein